MTSHGVVSETIHVCQVSILKLLVEKLACDASYPTVRLAVPQGLVYLLENSKSHAVLQAMLPRLFPLLNDADLRVRVAAADLLLVIKESRAIPFQRVSAECFFSFLFILIERSFSQRGLLWLTIKYAQEFCNDL